MFQDTADYNEKIISDFYGCEENEKVVPGDAICYSEYYYEKDIVNQIKDNYTVITEENIDTVIYSGENNEYENRIVIKDGVACVSQANCPDKICVGHRAVRKGNESIGCLPHKLVVEITSSASVEAPDVVV